MKLSDFDYLLPAAFIAQKPLEKRDHSKLMTLDRNEHSIKHHQFFELPKLLDPHSILVFNQSKVIPARLKFKQGEGQAEILLIKAKSERIWECMVKPGQKFTVGKKYHIDNELKVEVKEITPEGLRVIEFETEDLSGYLQKKGQTPLPPYIHEGIEDSNRYQTIYARNEGSVAAPTAGFHFTNEIFEHLKKRGIETAFVTLHVGLGTFQPVKVENISEHQMHSEWFEISEETAQKLNRAKHQGKKVVAVGTTSIRVLETCTAEDGQVKARTGETNIFIRPGYHWKFVDQLITNFHVPKSSLLMLVSALAGREFILKAYEEAKKNHYRFFSFGDCMWIK